MRERSYSAEYMIQLFRRAYDTIVSQSIGYNCFAEHRLQFLRRAYDTIVSQSIGYNFFAEHRLQFLRRASFIPTDAKYRTGLYRVCFDTRLSKHDRFIDSPIRTKWKN